MACLCVVYSVVFSQRCSTTKKTIAYFIYMCVLFSRGLPNWPIVSSVKGWNML